jgi:hypothetical protein
MYRRKEIQIVVRLPKSYKIDSLSANSIPLDENFMATVRENGRYVGDMTIREARRKFGIDAVPTREK